MSSKRKGLSIEKFARAKQHDANVTRLLKKKEFYRKAAIVRSYKRVRKHELGDSNIQDTRKPSMPNKGDRFHGAKDLAKRKEDERKRKEEDMEREQQEKKKRRKERAKQRRLLTKRTRKGQPIMKYQIETLLSKLEKKK